VLGAGGVLCGDGVSGEPAAGDVSSALDYAHL
jgi:hypothetical protein